MLSWSNIAKYSDIFKEMEYICKGVPIFDKKKVIYLVSPLPHLFYEKKLQRSVLLSTKCYVLC